jgi:FlaA1/EpsC-like NDP-sugar epimerase
MNILSLIGREDSLITDLIGYEQSMSHEIFCSKFLVLGGAGSIGQAVVKEIFKRNPLRLHVVDISENNLVELVRDIRSSFGYIKGEFKTFALDIGSREFDVYFANEDRFDYVINLSALKHVRSEKDPYTLMRMIDVNILNTIKTIEMSISSGVKKYFCVSTDKAANPANMMGASKRIMEMFLSKYGRQIDISTARFANVAFSDGSLLHGFQQRLMKDQPIAAPNDIRRYFVTPQESGELCLMSTLLGNNGDIFFPKLDEGLNMIPLSDIAVRFLSEKGFEAVECRSEEEARTNVNRFKTKGQWPCYFAASDTSGEKEYEEFFVADEVVDYGRFDSLGIVKSKAAASEAKLDYFIKIIAEMKTELNWSRADLIMLFKEMIPGFRHFEKSKSLDEKM